MVRNSVLAAAMAASCIAPAQAALVVSNGATSDVTCASGVCVATAADAVLNVKDVKAFLKQGDLTLASGAAAMDIRIQAKFDWTKPHRLTLDAFRAIAFTEAVTSQGTGGVTLITNDGGSGGDHTFTGQGKLAFWDTASSLIVNGKSYGLTASLADLAAKIASNPGGLYALAANLDASPDGTYAHAPVTTVFSGTFEGLGHIVDKMKIVGPHKAFLGLFGEIGAPGHVRDLKLTNAEVSNESGEKGRGRIMLGTLAGVNGGRIAHVFAAGVLHADRGATAGGLVGHNQGTIIDGSAAVQVSAGTNIDAGGLVGWNDASIVSSSASGDVTASTALTHGAIGGLVGFNSFGTIDASHASGAVKGSGGWNGDVNFTLQDIGGLVGTGGTITRSFATGNVTAGILSYVGGLCGHDSFIANSYATGILTFKGGVAIGGLIGFDYHTIATSYSTASVSSGGGTDSGGFIGIDHASAGSLSSDYWDLETSGVSDPSEGAGSVDNDPGITGLTTAQLKSALPAGFDPAVWGRSADINDGYPYLLANPPQ